MNRNTIKEIFVKGFALFAIKSIKPDVTFGISPNGNVAELISKYGYYVDTKKWVESDEYVDYIAPQLYWGFSHSSKPFDKLLKQWKSIMKDSTVKLYIGLAAENLGY